ncbi:TnsD family Tn7-like transposition protein [Kiloniella litopenaei]|uniref:TnsD family Tn7-like transposition protein n=1 Tax=Kiloniella litopenaei TaxID=1549748 RepID=UPI003BABB41B
MLVYFPVPYQDELLYSCIARYAVHTGQGNNQKAVVRDVFSTETAVAVPDLPSHLNNLVHNLRSVWSTSVMELIANQTLAPIYTPFLSSAQVRKILRSMASEKGGNIHTRAGIAASSIKPPNFFRYCPKCFEEQDKGLGEFYWARIHQLPGINVCLHHTCRLKKSSIYFYPRSKHHFYPASLECDDSQSDTIELSSAENRLIEMYAELLRRPYLKGLGPNRWTLFYQNLAQELGFTHKSRVQHKRIYAHIKQTWNETFLEKFLTGLPESNWLLALFRKHRKSFHPLKHLMVLSALTPERDMSGTLNQVKRFPAKPSTCSVVNHRSFAPKNEVIKYRKSWLLLREKHPNLGTQELRNHTDGGRLYSWLYRNDYDWLMCHRPDPIRKRANHYHVDYSKWDQESVEHLKSIYSQLQGLKHRPRLSRTQFIKRLPRANSLEKHLKDLPCTKEWLDAHEETPENYRLYRLQSAYETILELGEKLERWRLLRLANIRKEFITPRIDEKIQELMGKKE